MLKDNRILYRSKQKQKGKANQLDVGNKKDQHNSDGEKLQKQDAIKLQCQKRT